MHRHLRTLLALLALAAIVYAAGLRFPAPAEQPGINGFYQVMQVYDGDTISILKDGKRVSVRLIGIDTPEVNTPYTKAECFGAEASKGAHELMDHALVRIQMDPTQDMYDRYQRLLAYVFVPTDASPGGILANQYLIEQGFAREYTYEVPYAHQSEFRAAEAAARSAKKGLWGACQTS